MEDCVPLFYGITIRLAWDPPYHSKCNAVERGWGILEQHWNGALLDTITTGVQVAATMTWKGAHPIVELMTTNYPNGVKLSRETMELVEKQLTRDAVLGEWFIDITPSADLE